MPTLITDNSFFGYVPDPASSKRENRFTWALGLLLRQSKPFLAAFLSQTRAPPWVRPNDLARLTFQPRIVQDNPDLLLEFSRETVNRNQTHLMWVEVKVDAPVSEQQLRRYRKAYSTFTRSSQGILLTVNKPVGISDPAIVQMRWRDVWRLVSQAKTKEKRDVNRLLLRAYCELLESEQMTGYQGILTKDGKEYTSLFMDDDGLASRVRARTNSLLDIVAEKLEGLMSSDGASIRDLKGSLSRSKVPIPSESDTAEWLSIWAYFNVKNKQYKPWMGTFISLRTLDVQTSIGIDNSEDCKLWLETIRDNKGLQTCFKGGHYQVWWCTRFESDYVSISKSSINRILVSNPTKIEIIRWYYYAKHRKQFETERVVDHLVREFERVNKDARYLIAKIGTH
jgi:hypothetical protein